MSEPEPGAEVTAPRDTDPPAAVEQAPSGLTRVTVNLIPRSTDALAVLTDRLGLSRTDVLNRAVQVYLLVDDMSRQDNGLRVVRDDGAIERIHIL